jgi:hypothetical protein
MQETIDSSYEILELNVFEPIVSHGDSKKQHTYNGKDKQVILVVPKEIGTRRRLTNQF